jgi:hypothetical protein
MSRMRRADANGLGGGLGEHRGGVLERERAILGGEGSRAIALLVAHGHQARFGKAAQRAGVDVPHLAASHDGSSQRAHQLRSG